MSNVPITSLPLAISLDGSEDVPIVQGGTTKRTSIGEISTFPSSGVSFVVATSTPGLTGSRLLQPQIGVTTVTDGGALGNITVGVAANGIGNTQFRTAVANSVVGNAAGSTANVADIVAGFDGQVLRRAAGLLSFGAVDLTSSIAVNGVLSPTNGGTGVNNGAKTLTLGGNLTTSGAFNSTFTMTGATNVTFPTSGTLLSTATAGANPSASVGLTAVNGSATTFIRSDAAPALSQSIVPTWTGVHTFNNLVRGNDAGPDFATLPGIYNSLFFSTNGFPITGMFGQNTVPLVQTIAGGVDIPITANFGNHCAGVAGYARTASPGVGAVGLYGQGTIGGTGTGVYSIFGGNFVVGNTAGGGPGVGYNAEMYGVEIDINLKVKTGSVAPNGNVRGLYIQNNGADIQPTGRFNGVEVTGGATVPWKIGYFTENGAAQTGISLGQKTATINTASQAIEFRALSSTSVARSSQISCDADGFMSFVPGTSAGHFFFNSSLSLTFTIEDTTTRARQTTQSTSATSGALRSDGGLGIVKDAFIGGNVTVGVAGSALGTLALSGSTSGTTTLRPAAAASGTLTLPATTDTLVGRATTDTLTNKTLTAPAINSPTGLVKADVGLGNVDNTSDATKNAAVATLTNKTIDTASNTVKVNGTTVVTGADFAAAVNEGAIAAKLIGANFNSTADQALTITLPTGFTRYRVQAVIVSSPSISLTTAVGGIYTAAAKGGIALVAASTAWSPLTTNTAGASGSLLSATVVNGATAFYNSSTLYLSLTTPQGSAATADVTVIVQPLP